jgi:hypothetical protein
MIPCHAIGGRPPFRLRSPKGPFQLTANVACGCALQPRHCLNHRISLSLIPQSYSLFLCMQVGE